ncbi:MAG: tyrosine-type recombinase/integrase [Candidatus Obscuribacterales bacterium]|nr:tyrosine-type recombinase/integrase [Candidatus Obscuribacterales bacterium]
MIIIKDVKKLTFIEGKSGKQILWDTDGSGSGNALSGFGVRVYPSGKKSFVLFYRVKGRQHLKVLGQFGPLTLDQARERAAKDLASVIDDKDPLMERQKARQGTRFDAFCERYISGYAKQHKRSWVEDQRRIDKYLKPEFGSFRVDAITRSDIARFHGQLGEQYPYSANRCVEQLSKMFKLAQDWGLLDEKATNPASGIKAFQEEKRDRWVNPEEIPRLVEAINNEENFYGSQAMWLYLLTGLRKAEVLTLEWEHVDLTRNEIKIPAEKSKTKRTHYVHLSAPAVKLLDELPRQDGNPYVIPGAKPGQHLVNIQKMWTRVRKEAKVEDVRLHDLRRTVGSWLAQSGNSLHLIGRVLNHSSQSTTAIYAHFAQDHVKEALDNHGKQLLQIAKQVPVTFKDREKEEES